MSLTHALRPPQTMLEYQNIRIHEALERSCERRLRGYRVREVNST